jgi:catechol 2,3-dioxygenase-like lactoylglutathione lyase family enzyme
MSGVAKAEHVCLHVDDIERAADFYGDVFGLAEISRRDGVIYYGCGLDENFDLAIQEGETGLEHVAVRVAEEDLMRDVLDFKVSEAVLEDWSGGAFLRKGDTHHDIAAFELPGTPETHAAHHHTPFTVGSVDHMVQLIDRIRQAGLYLELGIGRHYAGDNLYAYFQAPDGHRIELNTQMAELDEDTPTAFVDSVAEAITAWRDDLEIPESCLHGSGLVETAVQSSSFR